MYRQRSSSAPDPSMSTNPGLAQQLQSHTTAAPRSSHSQRYRGRRGQIPNSPETGAAGEIGHGRDVRFARYPVIPPVGQNWAQQQRNSSDGENLEVPPTTRRAFESERPAVRHRNTEIIHPRLQPPHRYHHDDHALQQQHQTATGRPARRTHAQQGRQTHNNDLLGTQYPVLASTLAPVNVAGMSTLVPTVHAGYVPVQPMPTAYPMFPPYCPPLTMPYMNPYMPLAPNSLQYAPPLVQYPMVVQQGVPQPHTGIVHSRLPEIPELSPTDPIARLPEISELSPTDPNTDYEIGRRQREIEDYCKQQVLDQLAEEICQELIDSWLSEFAREVVNSCIGDIVSSYLLLDPGEATAIATRWHHELKPLDSKLQKQSTDPSKHNDPLLSILASGHPKRHSTPNPTPQRLRTHSNPTITTRRLKPVGLERSSGLGPEPPGEMLALNNPSMWRTQGKHNKVMHLTSNSELSQELAVMVLNELLFCELLETICDDEGLHGHVHDVVEDTGTAQLAQPQW